MRNLICLVLVSFLFLANGVYADLVAWYPLDEPPGTAGLVDHSGNGYNGGASDPTYTGESLLFNSDNNERAWAQGIPAKMDSSFTLALWAKADSAHEGFANLIGRTIDTAATWHDGAKAFILAADGVWFQCKGYTAVKTTTSLWDDQWHHVAATYDANDNSVRIYVDGVQEAVGTMDLTAWPEDISWYYWLSNGSGGNFSGEMKDVRIYDETLKNIEIAHMAKQDKAVDFNEDGLVDAKDLAFLAGEWLDCVDSVVNLNGDCLIDFLDFSEFAGEWKDESLRFLVFSDPHSLIDQVSTCIEDIKENPDLPMPEFIFCTGDQGLHGHPGPDEDTIEYMMTAPGQKYGWNDLFLPYFVLWGNHDATSYHANPRNPYFIPFSKKDWGLSNPFYSFEYDNILFLVVSSALGETRLLNQPQRDWLEQVTSMYPDKTTVIMTHRPLHNTGAGSRGRAYDYFMDTYSWWKSFLEKNPQIITYGFGHTAMVTPLYSGKFGINTIAHGMIGHGSPNTITYYKIDEDGVDIKYWNGRENEWVVQYLNESGYHKESINIKEKTSFAPEGFDWFAYPHIFQDGEKLKWENRMLAEEFKVQLIGEGKEDAELVWMNRKFNYFEPDEFACAARWVGYENDANNGTTTGTEETAFYSPEGYITFTGKDIFAAATSPMQENPPCTHERGHVPWSTTPWAVPGKEYRLRVKMKGEDVINDAISVKFKVLSKTNYARPVPDQPIDDPIMEKVVLDKIDLTEDYNWYEGTFEVPQNDDCYIIKTIWESHKEDKICYLDEWSVTRADSTDIITKDFELEFNGELFQTEGPLVEGEFRTFNVDPNTIDNELNFKAHIGGSRVGMVRLIYDDPILWSDDVSMGIIAKDDNAYNCRFEMAGHYPEGKVSLSPLSPDTKVEGAESQNIKDYQSWLLKEDDIPGEFLIYFP